MSLAPAYNDALFDLVTSKTIDMSRVLKTGPVTSWEAQRNADLIEQGLQTAAYLYTQGVFRHVVLPDELIQVHLPPSEAIASTPRSRIAAVRHQYSNVTFRSEGGEPFQCVLQSWYDGGGSDPHYGVMRGGIDPTDNGTPDNENIVIEGITFDANYKWVKPENYSHTIPQGSSGFVWEGLRNAKFRKLRLLNSGHYAFGITNGGYINNLFQDMEWINCYADGVDCKDNLNADGVAVSNNNVFDGIYIDRYGLGQGGYAGMDVNGRAWTVKGLRIPRMGLDGQGSPFCGLRFKNTEASSQRGLSAAYSRAYDIRIAQVAPIYQFVNPGFPLSGQETVAYYPRCDSTTIDGLVTTGCDIGVQASQPNTRVLNSDIEAKRLGVWGRLKEAEDQEYPEGSTGIDISGATKITTTASGSVCIDLLCDGAVIDNAKLSPPEDGTGIWQRFGYSFNPRNVQYATGYPWRSDGRQTHRPAEELDKWAAAATTGVGVDTGLVRSTGPSSAFIKLMEEFVRRGLFDGWWQDMVAVHALCGNTLLAGQQDVKDPKRRLAITGSVGFTPYTGFQGDGNSGALSYLLTPKRVALGDFGVSYFLKTPTNKAVGVNTIDVYMGATTRLGRGSTNTKFLGYMLDGTATAAEPSVVALAGAYTMQRTGSARTIWKDKASTPFYSDSVAPSATMVDRLVIGGVSGFYSNAVINFVAVHGYLGTTKTPLFQQAFMDLQSSAALIT